MQAASVPLKWYLPFAQNDTNRVEIPVTTSDATRASQSLGFPPLTMQPPESGGVPPQGEDFNGALNQVARVAWWLMAGGPYVYDASFATNTNIGGYPQGARLISADYLGVWVSTADNNQNNPDTNGTGWVPGYAYGTTAVSGLTNTNVTLTPAQAMKPYVTLAGALTGNVSIIVPAWVKEWRVFNNTSGAFTVTVTTAGGSGAVIPQNGSLTVVRGDGTNINLDAPNIAPASSATNAITAAQAQSQYATAFTAAGTAPNFTLTPSPAITAYSANQRFRVRFTANGTTGSNTLNVSGLGAVPLMQFDTAGNIVPATVVANQMTDVEYNGTQMIVLDPPPSSNALVGSVRNLASTLANPSTVTSFTVDEIIVKTALGGGSYIGTNLTLNFNGATVGANGMDTGTLPGASGFVAIYAIFNPATQTWATLGTNVGVAIPPNIYSNGHAPTGYTASALISILPTNSSNQLLGYVQTDRNVKRTAFPVSQVMSTATSQPAYSPLNLSGAIPYGAKTVAGTIQLSNNVANLQTTAYLSSTSNGVSTSASSAYLPATNVLSIVPISDMAIQQSLTLYYALWASGASTSTMTLLIGGYTF